MRLPVLQTDARRDACGCGDTAPTRRGVARRSFLRSAAAVTGGLLAVGAALSPLRKLREEKDDTFAHFFQKHYKEMTDDDKAAVFARIEAQVLERYGVEATVSDPPPLDEVEFVYALSLSRCNGNRRCVHACVAENNQSRNPQLQYIRVDRDAPGDERPGPGRSPLRPPDRAGRGPLLPAGPVPPVRQPPLHQGVPGGGDLAGARRHHRHRLRLVHRLPVLRGGLSILRPDASTLAQPEIPTKEINPDMGYLSNRPRSMGVMEKCTFCLHRTREGRLPACLEACPTGARKFGNLLDPNSEVSQILRNKRVFVLKEEVGTLPRFFYYFDERHPGTGAADTEQAAAEPAGEEARA